MKMAAFLSLQQHLDTLCSHAVSTARTLNTEHLSYFECGSSDFAQCVDYSLRVSLRQERRV